MRSGYLIKYLCEGLGRGVPLEQLIIDLKKLGWSEPDILENYQYCLPNKRSISTNLLYMLLFASILLLGYLVYQYQSDKYSINLPLIREDKQLNLSFGAQPALSNLAYYNNVKDSLLSQQADFLEADLSGMTVRVYSAGVKNFEVPIATKGREGSWWETPAGIYKINSKEKTHFSTMGRVWMPWSLNFQGNFFIHGRTYYPDGTLSSAEFTGGCIRLDTKDAERVYRSVKVGTPVLVYENNFASETSSGVPIRQAQSYLAADLGNGHVYSSLEPFKSYPIASLTKLMTALIATEYINLDNMATVPKEAIIFTSKPRLKTGEKYSVYQLLFPLLMESSNEAAETIARYYGRERFIKLMNDKAAAIGMKNTVFDDPSGASAGNLSTADDLYTLAKYIYFNRSFIFKITSGQITTSAYGQTEFSSLENLNDFVTAPYYFGGKNGKTQAAKETNLTVFNVPNGSGTRPIVFIVLASPDEKSETAGLIKQVFNQYNLVPTSSSSTIDIEQI